MFLFNNNKEKAVAFIGGFSFTAVDTWLHAIPILEIIEKLITTGLIGFVGGVAGLLSQDIYKYFKERFKKRGRL